MDKTSQNRTTRGKKEMDFDKLIESGLIDIFERIIKHAADREVEWNTFYSHDHHDKNGRPLKQAIPKTSNAWLFCMRKYSQVSKKWQRAILNPIDDLTSLVETLDFVDCTIAPRFIRGVALINNGFLAVAKRLNLSQVSSAGVDAIVKNLGENQIEAIELGRPKDWNATVAYTRFTDIIMRCDKATSFCFWFGDVDVESEEEAGAIVRMIQAAIHCNEKPKKMDIHFDDEYWDTFDWRFTDDFIGDPGSIGELILNIPPKESYHHGTGLDWSRFGSIESIRMYANMVDDFREMAVQTVTKSITLLFLAQSRSDLDDLHELVDGLSPQEIDVEISCACNPTLEDDDSPDSEGEEDALVWTKTFACDASLVENVRSWRCDIEAKIPWPFFEDENQKPKRRKISKPNE